MVSSVSRSHATAKPISRPRIAPRPMVSIGRGATGVVGRLAASTMFALIGAVEALDWHPPGP